MSGGNGRNGGFDPSNLHLKKELTQIRKASKTLKDPGTTSTWRSPLSSGRSLSVVANTNTISMSAGNNHYYHHYRSSSIGNVINGDDNNFEEVGNSNNVSSGKGKDKGVFLYNWKAQKSERESSVELKDRKVRYRGEDDESEDGDGLSSVLGESVDNSVSDARNGGGDSKSDTYIGEKYASILYKYRNTNLTPSGKRNSVKKKVKSAHSAALWKRQRQQNVLSKSSKPGSGHVPLNLRRGDFESLVDQSDDTSEYLNSEDLRRYSAESPLLARLKSSRLLRGSRKEDSMYSYSTPAMSTRSLNLYGIRNPSTVGSWDGTTESFNDGDDELDDHFDLAGQQGCGIPCWSRRSTPKKRGTCRSCYSPSLSDTLRRKGNNILCGSQSMYSRRRHGFSLSSSKKRGSRTAQGLIPLLSSSGEGMGGSSLGNSNDELSTNYGELDLEALSRLDGRRWSASCRSEEGLELVALNGERESESTPENLRSLSQKYRPVFFEELIGQNIVVQSLMNAIPRGRIAPIYLFQGPRGTGKTSTARIFSAALSCLAKDETKPCGVCRSCAEFLSGKSKNLIEVDSSNKKGIGKVRYLLKTLFAGHPSTFSLYKVFVIDECHLLPAKTWLTFLKFLEEPPPRVVFIFITTDIDNVPRAVLSRSQKYIFNKIKDGDIVSRLRKIAAEEELDVESDALDLIAVNADGSLRDAETMLDQLALLGKRITTSLVNELVGVVSDEKLLELLELALSSDTAETVKRAREMMDSGIDPMLLMPQLATLIMDIIAGTYHIVDAKGIDSFIGGRSLNEAELERLKHALKLLSEAEKHLRVSSERSTWFTATLLQLGSIPSPEPTQSVSSRRQSSRTTDEDPSSTSKEVISQNLKPDTLYTSRRSTSPMSLYNAAHRKSTSQDDPLSTSHGNFVAETTKTNMLDDIWNRCIERCHSKTLRQLLHNYGKLVSISEVEGAFVAYIAFTNSNIKLRAERFLSSITNSLEIVLRRNVEVRIVLLPEDDPCINSERQVALVDPMVKEHETQVPFKLPRGSFNDPDVMLAGKFQSTSESPVLLADENVERNGSKEREPVVPAKRIESIIHEQRLETAWLQTAEKGTPGTLNRSKPERNQVLPQDGVYHQNQMDFTNPATLSSQHWEDELKDEISALKIYNGKEVTQNGQVGKQIDHYPMSPSLLHNSSYNSNFSKETMGYESSSGAGGCSGLFCWNNHKHHTKGKIKQRAPVRKHKGGRFLWLGECAKSTKTEEKN
ncbi:Protein STICHEL like [Heracleum sosnowskyi]|uniref:Protein STICHEL like n=1 Tax=Heracleum sosnowskyi TaxID=360622 RepID=A0AAD8LWX5_9APIA|nr:Protein STICHEL like [Heracleum sosnowskyi]KAK1385837.1 Protein STICHEL like [Heracleum sosnowskyi]